MKPGNEDQLGLPVNVVPPERLVPLVAPEPMDVLGRAVKLVNKEKPVVLELMAHLDYVVHLVQQEHVVLQEPMD